MASLSPRSLVSFCCAALFAASVPALAQDEDALPPPPPAPAGPSLLKQIDQGFADIYERVVSTVVVIEATKRVDVTETEEGKPFDFLLNEKEKTPPAWKPPQQQPTRSEGSGFFIRSDGLILTNLHVVADSEKLNVRTKDSRNFPARILGSDDKTDIAVLKIDIQNAPVVDFGDSDALRVGQIVCAIGTPYNQSFSFTCGWISGKGRSGLLGPTSSTILYEDYLQTDAFINPGNSGGPLFDVDGKVIGMNTLINGIGRGLAFAIPSNTLERISTELMTVGKIVRPWLGIRIESLSENPLLSEHAIGLEHGVVVLTIEANTPAYKSELRPADIITEVDGVRVAAALDLQKEVLKKRVGQTVYATVWRSGQVLKIPILTAELPGDLSKTAAVEPKVEPKKPFVESEDEGYGMKLKDAKPGAEVVSVIPDSAASLADLQPDDMIVDVEGKTVSDPLTCLAAIRSAGEKANHHGVLLNIDRKGKRTYLVIDTQRP